MTKNKASYLILNINCNIMTIDSIILVL